ncbi:hypothetical protein F3N42_05650 [Marinihelvus fidelis]|uniref:Uncharacterized protein n=1 Tax=Marinihelvus fidelis TaxID=2613842 RepID=A0A5N0TDD1_9GAMM|nr:hypothetical protein [Marinihelvus fidelis]KAA9132698.1 hypothetical protein F3N42_05650 [Marinihelvus fidelis]
MSHADSIRENCGTGSENFSGVHHRSIHFGRWPDGTAVPHFKERKESLMKYRNRWRLLATTLVLVLAALPVHAAMVKQMGLDDLVGNADKVFRGTVLDKQAGTVSSGGGELPIVIYTLSVNDAIKGDFGQGKAAEVIEVRMFGRLKAETTRTGNQRLGGLDMNPDLRVGREYVLFTTKPGSGGLSTTVGLGQGLFEMVLSAGGNEQAVNGFNNQGLFDGPVDYADLIASVRSLVK